MTSEFAFELKRQGVHLLAGCGMAAAVWIAKPLLGDLILVPMLAIVAGLWLSPRIPHDVPVVGHLIEHFERGSDKERFPFKGAFWFNAGIIFPTMLLPLDYAVACIIVLSVGDASSTVIGKFFGRHRIGHKSVEGLTAFFVLAGAAAYPLVGAHAFILSLAGGVIEFIEVLDDNFLIPAGLTAVAKAALL